MIGSNAYTSQKAKLPKLGKLFRINATSSNATTQKRLVDTRKTNSVLLDRIRNDLSFNVIDGSNVIRNIAKSLDSSLDNLGRPNTLADFEIQFGEMRRQLELDILRGKNVTVQQKATLEKLNDWFRSLKKYTIDPRLEQLKKDLDSLKLLEE